MAVFDIDEQGNIVAVKGEPPRRVQPLRPAPAGAREAAVGLDGSDRRRARGLHLRRREQRARPARARRPHGKVLKRLDRYGERRWPEGEIALTERWAAWSVKRATYDEPTGPGNVFLKKL